MDDESSTAGSTDALTAGAAALASGRWHEARVAFESAVAEGESAEGCLGLATALWWLGDSDGSVARAARAYTLYRRSGAVEQAVQSAVWLGITYKANFANHAAANGWLGRADRLLGPLETGPLHGWRNVARAYRMADLEVARTLTVQAIALARTAGDVDLELVAISQLGLIDVGRGDTAAGFALIDEATAAVLAGEPSSLDTVVYACCDMLNACELTSDVERAAQWCRVADDFVDRYGCPFLYAECRIYYGSVLTATGRWSDAERELAAGLRITTDTSPGLHIRALTRLATLRTRQGHLEEAAGLLAQADADVDSEAETTVALAALELARGDAAAASRRLEQRLARLDEHQTHLVAALDLLVEARLAVGQVDAAGRAADRLSELATESDCFAAASDSAQGRVARARGEATVAVDRLSAALGGWLRAGRPFEAARARAELGRVLAATAPGTAVDHLRRAVATFDDLGAVPEADRAAAGLHAMGVAARPGAKGVGLLTDREWQVLQLLAAGLSNPEIAARLHVSRKTAAHHVSHILTKLDLRNRTEAAALAAAIPHPSVSGRPGRPETLGQHETLG